MDRPRYEYLINKYLNNNTSRDEEKELLNEYIVAHLNIELCVTNNQIRRIREDNEI